MASMINDLWDGVALQLDVLVGLMRQAERNYVAHSLDLMEDSVRVGQVYSIFRGWLSRLSNHFVYLSLDFSCEVEIVKKKKRKIQ